MVPLLEVREDERPRRGFPPVVVTLLIVANLWVFVQQLAARSIDPRHALEMIRTYALIPRLAVLDPVHGFTTVFTSMFLHGGWVHVLGNLWFLWIFGPSVERVLGPVRFSLLYLLGGLGAALAQVWIDPWSTVPMIGASGAIGAVLSAYVSMFPWRRILAWGVFVLWPVPAVLFVAEWFLLNLVRGMGSLAMPEAGGVAWWAHVGGFLAGIILIRALFPYRRDDVRRSFAGSRRDVRSDRVEVRDRWGRPLESRTSFWS